MHSLIWSTTSVMLEDLESMEASIVEALLGSTAALQFRQGDISHSILRPVALRLKELSSNYLERTSAHAPLITDEHARAYALYYLLINYVKIKELLDTIPSSFWKGPKRVLDFGCGPGTATLAILPYLTPASSCLAVDSSSSMLRIAEMLIGKFAHGHRWKCTKQFERSDYDLIVAANVLNEVNDPELEKLLEGFINALPNQGLIILLEPALQNCTRRLMKVRDLLCERYDLVPLYPCTRSDSCPMLRASSHDWCHATLNWQRPRLIRQLDEMTNFNKHRIKFSGFVFHKGGVLNTGYRVITPSKKQKRGATALLCGPSHYGEVCVPSREKSPGTSTFWKLDQHDRIVIEGQIREGKLTRETTVRIESSLYENQEGEES